MRDFEKAPVALEMAPESDFFLSPEAVSFLEVEVPVPFLLESPDLVGEEEEELPPVLDPGLVISLILDPLNLPDC